MSFNITTSNVLRVHPLCYNTPSIHIQISSFCSLGDAETAACFARQLLALGADPNLRSHWTNMRALHYAAYFDVPQLIRVVSQASQPGGEQTKSKSLLFVNKDHLSSGSFIT